MEVFMKKLAIVFVVLALVGAGTTVSEAVPEGKWKKIGSRTVTDRMDHDVIPVGAERGHWRAVKFVVKKRAVEFHDVQLVFGDGTRQEVRLRAVIQAGGESRVIDLVGDRRVIKRIEFTYDAQSLGGEALVKVFGKR